MKIKTLLALLVAAAPLSQAAVIQVGSGGTTDPGLSGGGTISDQISVTINQSAFTSASL